MSAVTQDTLRQTALSLGAEIEKAVQDPTAMSGTSLLDNSHTCIPFDSRAERSFVNQQFRPLLTQIPQNLRETFTVEMANDRT